MVPEIEVASNDPALSVGSTGLAGYGSYPQNACTASHVYVFVCDRVYVCVHVCVCHNAQQDYMIITACA